MLNVSPTHLRAVSYLTSVSVAYTDCGGLNASSRRNSESSPDLRWPRVSRSTIVQLPCACDPPHTPSTDAHMKADSLKNRLLQFCAVRRTVLHHSEAPVSPERRGAYRSGSVLTFSSTFVLAQGGSTTTWSLTLTLSSKMSNCGDIIRWTVYLCVCRVQKKRLCIWNVCFNFRLTHASIHR